ncbi:MAG: TetR/AcrR family transcriptional regulator [Deltaproteobacteria bacterium]|nr:TetR/AcrR family transcriptional regulator [Deltaproteobacteria bacterium]
MRPISQAGKPRGRTVGRQEASRPGRIEGEASTLSRREVIEEHLLEVAAKRFASTGYRQTTLEEIARHAGVAKASMYRYFENKQELLAKIFLKVAGAFARSIQPLLTAPLPPEEKLRRTVQGLLRTIGENVALFTVFYSEEADLPPRLRAEVLEVRQRFVANLAGILREGMEQGVFRELDARLVVYAIMGMCAWLHKWYGPGEGRLEDVAAAFVGLIERGCLASRGAEERDCLADRLRHVQDLLGALVGQAERLEQGGGPARR